MLRNGGRGTGSVGVALLLALPLTMAAEGVRLRLNVAVYADGGGAGLRGPEGIGSEGAAFVVADTGNGRVVRFRIVADRVVPEGTLKIPEIPYPIGVQIDPNGDLLVLDGKLRRIARVGTKGEFKGYLEPIEDAAPRAFVPRSLRIDASRDLYVLDVGSGRLLVLDPTQKVKKAVPFPKERGFFSDLALDGRGNVFLLDSLAKRLFVLRKDAEAIVPLNEKLKEDLEFPIALTVDAHGHLFIADQGGAGIVVLGSDGSFRGRQLSLGWKEGLLRYPSGLAVGSDGKLIVSDRENQRVQLFTIVE